MKLELKHLAPYLPYEVKVLYENKSENLYGLKADMVEISIRRYPYISKELIQNIKPILRPLSDLTKEIDVDGEKFMVIDKWDKEHENDDYMWEIAYNDFTVKDILNYPYYVIQQLFEWRFDVFGLIKEGLAIDINTLQS